MATCPRCKGHLTDTHRCPLRAAIAITEIALAGIGGGLAGLLLVAAVDPRNQVTAIDSFAILTGAVIGVGVDRLLRH